MSTLVKSGLIDNLTSSPTRIKDISSDEYNKCTQTIETAFVPCEGCYRVQKNLREVGNFVTNICESQELPSSLLKHKAQVEDLEWMSSNDVARWTVEQNKDLARINKHLEFLTGTIGPLKEELATQQKKSHTLENKVSQCQKQVKIEKETASTQQKQFCNKLKELDEKKKEELGEKDRQNKEVVEGKNELTMQLETLKTELSKQQDFMSTLGKGSSSLKDLGDWKRCILFTPTNIFQFILPPPICHILKNIYISPHFDLMTHFAKQFMLFGTRRPLFLF